jgi:hypothetical protein
MNFINAEIANNCRKFLPDNESEKFLIEENKKN